MPQDITVFAETNFRNQFKKFGIKDDDRRRHMYLIGKTGMGKSTILENMIIDDIRSGKGVMVVDPHGDLAEKIIEYIPSSRVNEVIYFNPSDMEYPIAFNIVEQVEPHLRHLVASGLIGVFKKLWADSWGPRLEYILRNAILAILDYPGSTLLAVTRMLSDKNFRKKVIDKIQDPVVKSFWVNEFAGYANNFASEAVSPIQNKVGQFLSSSLIRNIVGQVKSSIDLREVMDSGKILILNLSKGRIGEDNSALLGAMMITKVQLSVMSRVDIPEKERKDFYLYIDEFQNFTTDSFANILSEARKYRLNLIMAHQYIEQLGEIVKPAVFGNVGTLVVFRVGAADAEELVKEFTPVFTEEDLVNLAKYEFYIKLMIDGVSSDPFSARGLAPLTEEEKTGNKEKMIKVSRERYAKQRAVVEDKINRWHENSDEPVQKTSKETVARPRLENPPRTENPPRPAAPSTKLGTGRKEIPRFFLEPEARSRKEGPPRLFTEGARPAASGKYDAVCSRCGRATSVSFRPDGIRPIFCKDCLSLAKREKKQEIEARLKAKRKELDQIDSPGSAPAAPPVASAAEPVSLSQAMASGPVDFSGRKIEPRRGQSGENKNQSLPENKISEGEEISL